MKRQWNSDTKNRQQRTIAFYRLRTVSNELLGGAEATRGGKVIFEQTLGSICIEVDISGKIEIRIIDRCTKANSKYYCEQVL